MSRNGRFLSRNGRSSHFHFFGDGFLMGVSEKPSAAVQHEITSLRSPVAECELYFH